MTTPATTTCSAIALRKAAVGLVNVFDYGAPVGFRLAVSPPERDHHLAGQQCIRGGVERGLEPDPGLLKESFAGKPCGPTRLPGARSYPVAVHTRRAEPRAGVAGCLDLQLCASRPARQ